MRFLLSTIANIRFKKKCNALFLSSDFILIKDFDSLGKEENQTTNISLLLQVHILFDGLN